MEYVLFFLLTFFHPFFQGVFLSIQLLFFLVSKRFSQDSFITLKSFGNQNTIFKCKRPTILLKFPILVCYSIDKKTHQSRCLHEDIFALCCYFLTLNQYFSTFGVQKSFIENLFHFCNALLKLPSPQSKLIILN